MINTILKNENEAVTPRFASTADTVKVTAKYRSLTEVTVTVWCFDRNEEKSVGYTQKYPAMEREDGELVFCFDPVSFSVYKGAETFQITLTADELSICAFAISEENTDMSEKTEDTHNRITTLTEDGQSTMIG